MITSVAARNSQKFAAVKRQMLTGQISYDQAKAELQPIIDDVNRRAAEIAKKYGRRATKVSVEYVLRATDV